ncbi:hypothetical protein RUND412_007699 [Rhizina undulata]
MKFSVWKYLLILFFAGFFGGSVAGKVAEFSDSVASAKSFFFPSGTLVSNASSEAAHLYRRGNDTSVPSRAVNVNPKYLELDSFVGSGNGTTFLNSGAGSDSFFLPSGTLVIAGSSKAIHVYRLRNDTSVAAPAVIVNPQLDSSAGSFDGTAFSHSGVFPRSGVNFNSLPESFLLPSGNDASVAAGVVNVNPLCTSAAFQPTFSNWWNSNTIEWLKEFTIQADRNNKNDFGYDKRGLLGQVARKFLGVNKISNRANGFEFECSEIIRKNKDPAVARKVFFLMKSAANLDRFFTSISTGLRESQGRLETLITTLPLTADYWNNLDATTQALFLNDATVEAVNLALGTASAWTPVSIVSDKIANRTAILKQKDDSILRVSSGPLKWDRLFDPDFSEPEIGYDYDATNNRGSAEGSNKKVSAVSSKWGDEIEANRPIQESIENGDYETAFRTSKETFDRLLVITPNPIVSKLMPVGENPDFGAVWQDAVVKAVAEPLEAKTQAVMHSANPETDGTTEISKLLQFGNYLAGLDSNSLLEWTSDNVAELVTRSVFNKVLNAAMRTQKIYISCTRDLQTKTETRKGERGPAAKKCAKDNTGPQDLKACLDNQVCYMYNWKDKSSIVISHRNNRPKSSEDWIRLPFKVNTEDIIKSSVATYLQGKSLSDENPKVQLATVPSDLYDPTSARTFTVPVCMSKYNWNTPITKHDPFCATDPQCIQKNLPCNCGIWGEDTESVWQDLSIWTGNKFHGEYSKNLCPRQIKRNILDPLERYVALCRLNVRRVGDKNREKGLIKLAGKDKHCDTIIAALKSQGNPDVSMLDPEMKVSLLCQVTNGGRGCKMYKDSYEDLAKELTKMMDESEA